MSSSQMERSYNRCQFKSDECYRSQAVRKGLKQFSRECTFNSAVISEEEKWPTDFDTLSKIKSSNLKELVSAVVIEMYYK